MTLNELNESLPITQNDNQMTVYLDKKNGTFRFADPKDRSTKRGMKYSISNKREYDKLTRKYKIDSEFDDFTKIANSFKKNNTDSEMRRVLADMQKDLIKNKNK